MHGSTIGTSESTHGTALTLSETTAPGQTGKQPKFRATIEPPSPPSASSKQQQQQENPSPSRQTSERLTTQNTDLRTPFKDTLTTGAKEEGPTNFFAEAGRRLSMRMVS